MSLSFEALLGDCSVETFFRDYYEKKPYVLHRQSSAFYQSLMTLSDVDFLVSSIRDPNTSIMRLANGDKPPPALPSTRSGYIDVQRLYDYYYQGMSLVLQNLDQRWPAFKAVSESFSKGFSDVSISLFGDPKLVLFLTPNNAQALPPHYDSADLFILQLEGEKRWRLYGYEKELAVMRHKLANPTVRDEVLQSEPMDLTLKAGDLLYFPRGYVHEALTGSEHSLHLTLSIEQPLTWHELMERYLMEQVDFRRTVPPGFLKDGRLTEEGLETLREMVGNLAASPNWAASWSDVNLKPATRGADQSGGSFARINDCRSFNDATMVQRRVETVGPIEFEGLEVRMDYGFGFVKGPLAMIEALNFMRERKAPFCLADVPGAMGETSKLTLVRRLLRDGFLERV